MQVVAELVRRGYDVLLPVGDSLRYDVVVDLIYGFRRIQVKTARLRNNVLLFDARSVNYERGKIVSRHYRDGADDFIAYEPVSRRFYGIAVKDAPATVVHLRVKPCANRQVRKIRDARDYTLDNLCEKWQGELSRAASRP
jgi:hypothetical protein